MITELTLCMRFDVPGIFARDLNILVDFATEWYAAKLEAPVVKVFNHSFNARMAPR